jgi:peptidoglycan DL-endopeptidase CwlO
MTRNAIGRFRRTMSPLIGAICCISLVTGLAPATAHAAGLSAPEARLPKTSDDKQREVNAILDELDRLAEAMDNLSEDYAGAVNDGLELDKEIAATEGRVKAKEVELGTMQAQLQNVALKTFVGSSISNSLASILSSTGTLSDAVRKSYLTSVALNTGVSGLDALQGKI